jgi:hypothetical protein
MRSVWVVLLASLMIACSGAGVTAVPASVDGKPLSELLPASVNGVETTKRDMNVISRTSPRVFLKTLGRLGKTPPDAEVALAYESSASVFAFRVDGVSGADILLAFIAESANIASGSFSPAPTVSLGGKQVMNVGKLAGTFLYSTDEVFYYIECPDEPTAIDMLQQLP